MVGLNYFLVNKASKILPLIAHFKLALVGLDKHLCAILMIISAIVSLLRSIYQHFFSLIY